MDNVEFLNNSLTGSNTKSQYRWIRYVILLKNGLFACLPYMAAKSEKIKLTLNEPD